MPIIRLSSLLLALLAVFATGTSTALAAPVTYGGIAADGSVAAFSTKEKMVPGDTDQEEDVYIRAFDSGLGEYVTRQVSLGPTGGNDTLPSQYNGISADGTEVFFSTVEQMVPGDTDHAEDVYVRNLAENRTVLVSAGGASCAAQGCGNAEVKASFASGGVPPAGGKAFFTSTERLTSADGDSSPDLYVHDLEEQETVLVSVGGAGTAGPSFRGTDQTGSKAFFVTTETLLGEDTDAGERDVYQRDLETETTSLISVPGVCPNDLPPGENCEPSYGGASPDGDHVFFETNERLSGEDKDSSQDVYDWSGGAIALVSIGPDGGNSNEKSIVTYSGSSGDGATVYFLTRERLDATADADEQQDVYQRAAGVTTLVSAGESGKGNGPLAASFSWASTAPGPQVVVFTTAEALTSEDTDEQQDVYRRSAGVTTLVSIGPGGGNGNASASFGRAAEDGSKIFFSTTESLLAEDADSSLDIYRRSGSETVWVSAGQINGNGPFAPSLFGASASGDRAFFSTQERLTEGDDFAGETDVYSWSEPGKTLLVSVKNSPDLVLGPPPPTLEKTVPASPNPSTTPTIVGQATSGALIKIYKTFDCSGEPVAEGTAEQLASPGLTVTAPVALGATTNFRATAEAEGIVSVCSSPVSYKQEEAAPPPPPPPPPPPAEEGTAGTGTGGGKTGGSGGKTGGNGITYVTPLPRITFAPAGKTRLRRPTFRFVDATEQPGTRFFCRVDRQKWAVCTSPVKLKKLKLGRHVFTVKAVNALGTAGASPVKRTFRVVR